MSHYRSSLYSIVVPLFVAAVSLSLGQAAALSLSPPTDTWATTDASARSLLSSKSTSVSKPLVAVVNCFGYHYEIVMGVAYLLSRLDYDIQIYTWQHNAASPTALKVMTDAGISFSHYPCTALHTAKPWSNQQSTGGQPGPASTNAVVFVTPQDEIITHRSAFMRAAVKSLKPLSILNIIHHAHPTDYGRYIALQRLAGGDASYVKLITLSPRTLQGLRRFVTAPKVQAQADWLLPIMPVLEPGKCAEAPYSCVHHGFAVQGLIDQTRRDYKGLYANLVKHLPEVLQTNMSVKLIGRVTPKSPTLPDQLKDLVSIHGNLGFRDYYSEIASSIALLPIVAGHEYLSGNKITSTLVTSLITLVPVLADSGFRTAYDFLPASAFYHHSAGESIAEAMLKVKRMSPEKHQAVRASLAEARSQLFIHNADVLQRFLEQAQKVPDWDAQGLKFANLVANVFTYTYQNGK